MKNVATPIVALASRPEFSSASLRLANAALEGSATANLPAIHTSILAFLLTLPLFAEPAARQIDTGRLQITIGQNALPSQISIQPALTDLPLEHRTKGAPPPTEATLATLGRGPQLAAPMHLEAIVEGKQIELTSAAPAPIEKDKNNFHTFALLTGGGLTVKVDTNFTLDGAMHCKLTYGGGKVDSLSLAMKLQGQVDTVIEGSAPFKSPDYALPLEDGILWGNAAQPTPAPAGPPPTINRGKPGMPPHLFWGNGDRGFTWLTDSKDGWTVTPVAAAMTLSRDKAGNVTWRAQIVNHPTNLQGEKTVAFSILTHPATSPAPDRRKVSWLAWPKAGSVLADQASLQEGRATAILLQGQAGGDARSASDTLADAYPLTLFRYLAGTHTGKRTKFTDCVGLSFLMARCRVRQSLPRAFLTASLASGTRTAICPAKER